MTSLTLKVNVGDSDIAYGESGAEYITLDLLHDYLIWTAGDDTIKDGLTYEPSESELIDASPIIDPDTDLMVALCLLFDYSAETGDPCLFEINGMGENAQFVFAFSFDGATATEPQLEAWDDDTMLTIVNKVLGGSNETPLENPEDSMVCAICTTGLDNLPGSAWVGTAIAGSGSTRVLKLNNGDGALPDLESGETSQELYANIKILIPANFAYPAIETFSLIVRYSFI